MTKQNTHNGINVVRASELDPQAYAAARANASQNRADKWASLIEACEMGSESGADTVRKLLAQRDELLAACKKLIATMNSVRRYEAIDDIRLAIAKAGGK